MRLFRKKIAKRASKKSGFLLLTAILISTVVLSVGISMASITYKEIALSITGKDSMMAFFAADAGAECAAYWDIRGTDVFPIHNDVGYQVPAAGSVTCNGQDITLERDGVSAWNLGAGSNNPIRQTNSGSPAGGSATTRFSFRLGTNQELSTNPCADVTVAKVWTDSNNLPGSEVEVIDPGEVRTTITSNGFSSCEQTNIRRVQRTLEQTY